MSPQEAKTSWTLRDGMPLSGDATFDALHARVLTESPIPADAIVWLQGNGYDRGSKVLELFRAGYAPCIVITGNRVRSPVTVDHLARWCADRSVPLDAVTMDVDAMHTRDQAVHVLALAQVHMWQALLLVASPHHQLRAFRTFVQRAEEIGWRGRIVNQPAAMRWDAIPTERTCTARVACVDEWVKCAQYPSHVAPVQVAAAYPASYAYHHPHR